MRGKRLAATILMLILIAAALITTGILTNGFSGCQPVDEPTIVEGDDIIIEPGEIVF